MLLQEAVPASRGTAFCPKVSSMLESLCVALRLAWPLKLLTLLVVWVVRAMGWLA